jgi:hypothetical protein
MVVEVAESGDRLEVGLPVELFRLGVTEAPMLDDYAVTADGQRFLVKMPIEADRLPEIQVVLNWTSLLE